jgi:uncharacterized protein
MQEGIFNTTQLRILAALALLMVMIALASYARLNFERVHYVNPIPATITVSGEGEVFAIPDIGKFSFSVMAEAETAGEAQELSGVKINDILAYLAEQGIEEKDIKTENYNLYPRWRYEERVCPVGSYCPPGERVQDGFTVSQTVSVKVRDTKEAGSIIAGVGERGAADISGLNFTVDDSEALRVEARAKAIEDAKEKAVTLAGQLGVRLVRITSYNEGGDYYQPYARLEAFSDADSVKGFGGPDLPMGEESTIVRVSVNYEIR